MDSSLYSGQLSYSSYFRRNSSKKITYDAPIEKKFVIFLLFYKGLETGEIDEGTYDLEISQRHKAELMGPRKLAFVQKYLEDVADIRSMTTNVSDSGLATQTVASELGTEEIHGKLVL